MKVPLVRGCGCVHEEYRTIQYPVKECSAHARNLMRSRQEYHDIIDRRMDQRERVTEPPSRV
jgi:hypothetical protein